MTICRLLLVVFLLACLPPAMAEQPRLKLVTGDDYAPFTGMKLPGGGMLTQLVMAALAEQHLQADLDWLPWKRGYLYASQSRYDGTFPYVPAPDRVREFLYSEPVYTLQQHFFSRSGEAFEPDNLSTLNGKRLCYPLGWQPPAVVQQLLDQGLITRHSPPSLTACAKLLLLQRDDFFVADRLLGQFALRDSGKPLTAFHTSGSSLPHSSLHFIVARQHPQAAELIERFNAGLAALQASGKYAQIIEQYSQAPAD